MLRSFNAIFLLAALTWGPAVAYNTFLPPIYKLETIRAGIDYAEIARTLVHQANWASVGSISTNNAILGYPMVNVISTDDSDANGTSTGKIHFMLMDLDFTGQDWQQRNEVTFMYTDEQNLNCKANGADPMDHNCPRVMLSGQVKKLDPTCEGYADDMTAFKNRHPAAADWEKAHMFYLCELEIQNIFVFAARISNVSPQAYYNSQPKTVAGHTQSRKKFKL